MSETSLSAVVWRYQDLKGRGDLSDNTGEMRAIAREAWEAADRVGDPMTWHDRTGAADLLLSLRKLAADLWNRAAAFDALEGDDEQATDCVRCGRPITNHYIMTGSGPAHVACVRGKVEP